MSRRVRCRLGVLACVLAVSWITAGCSKKSIVLEEAGARPAPVVEAKKEVLPAPIAPPRVEAAKPPAPAPAPVPAPKPEAAPKAEAAPPAPAGIDWAALRVQFAFDDYSLSTRSKENLRTLAGWMKKSPGARVQVEGHTCDLGSNEYNLALSERRALAAKKHLEDLGISSTRITVIGYGEEKPLVPNSSEKSRSRNRRAEFVPAK